MSTIRPQGIPGILFGLFVYSLGILFLLNKVLIVIGCLLILRGLHKSFDLRIIKPKIKEYRLTFATALIAGGVLLLLCNQGLIGLLMQIAGVYFGFRRISQNAAQAVLQTETGKFASSLINDAFGVVYQLPVVGGPVSEVIREGGRRS